MMAISALPELAAPAKFQNNILLADIAGGKDTNPMLMSKVSNEAFAKALKLSLKDNGYLAEGADGKYVLDSDLLGLERLRLANEKSVQNNIKSFIETLAEMK